MEIKKIIKDLIDILPEPVDYAEMVGAPGWAYGCKYVYEDPEYYLIAEAAKALEKLSDENQQLRNDLIMQTALAQNGQSVIETNKQLTRKFEALLKDFKEFILHTDDVCKYCKHNQPCRGAECESYVKGRGVEDLKGYKYDWQRSCEDFNFGECPMLENTLCNGCIKNNMQGFEWRGM